MTDPFWGTYSGAGESGTVYVSKDVPSDRLAMLLDLNRDGVIDSSIRAFKVLYEKTRDGSRLSWSPRGEELIPLQACREPLSDDEGLDELEISADSWEILTTVAAETGFSRDALASGALQVAWDLHEKTGGYLWEKTPVGAEQQIAVNYISPDEPTLRTTHIIAPGGSGVGIWL